MRAWRQLGAGLRHPIARSSAKAKQLRVLSGAGRG